nr:hypothetical protein [Tanacetum cinerariifolium]
MGRSGRVYWHYSGGLRKRHVLKESFVNYVLYAITRISTQMFVDPEISTQADEAQGSRVPVPLPDDPYVAVRQARLVDTVSEPEEAPFEAEELQLLCSKVLTLISLRPILEVLQIGIMSPVMSDVSSTVTYTSVYTDFEPWRYYGEDSAETGPPRVIVYGYEGLPLQPVAPPSPDYVPGPEHPPSPDYVPGPEHPPSPIEVPYVPEPEYPEYLAPSDDEAPLEDQPLPADASPIAASSDYVADSDPEEDPKEDPEDDQTDYPADGGDGDDEPFDDDDDDDIDDEDPEEEPFEEDDEEKEEHSAPVDSFAVPIGDLVLSARETEALEDDEPTHAPGSPISILFSQTRYRAAGIRMRALLPSTSRRTNISEADMPPRKRACLTTPTLGFEIGESFAVGVARQPGPTESELRRCRVEQAGYGITDTWDEIVDKMMKIAPTTLEGVNERVTELDTTVRQRTDEFEVRFEYAQFDRALLRARVNTLFRDRPGHRRTTMLMDREAMYSREAWAFSIDMSSAIEAHVRTLETQVAALITQTTSVQTQLTMALRRIEELEARDPEPLEGPKMAPKKRTTSATPANTTTPTTTVTNAQLQALIDRGIAAALEKCNADRSRNGDTSNDLGTGGRRQMATPREFSYTDFLKKCLDMVEVPHESCWIGCCLCNAMGGLEKDDHKMFPEEAEKVERYIGGLSDMIHDSVKASKPQSMQEAIEFATEMMDKKMLTHYGGIKPLCPKCNYHHDGPCTQKCTNCRKTGHWTHDCKSRPTANNNNQRAQGANARGITCFECGVQGHYKSECPMLKNGNQENRAENGNDVARAYALGTAGTNPNSNVVTGTFLLNNSYALVLFDNGADRSFLSSAFSSLIDIIPTTLDHGYDVELTDGRIIWVNTLIRGCTLNFLNHPFNIDVVPVEMGSCDVIIGMDWLVKNHAMIVCDKKLVRVPFGNEILVFHGRPMRLKESATWDWDSSTWGGRGECIGTVPHFKTLSFDELRSPNFNLFSDQEYSEEKVAKTMAETMEQYMSKTQADYGSRVARPKIKDKDNFALKGQFLKELRTNTFKGSNHEDANEHIEKVLEIVDLFHIPNTTIDQVMLRAFPMFLTGATSCWLRNEPTCLITNYVT